VTPPVCVPIYCAWLAGHEWEEARLAVARQEEPRKHAGLTVAWPEPDGWYCGYCGKRVLVAW